ncbi:MAG: enoyl-CoA hydratase/isomerase family protein [Acidimicrobiales bacterium]
MSDPVRLEITDSAAIVTLDAPPLNIFNLEMRDGLIEAFSAVHQLDGIGAMILRADGAHFSAGADLSEFGTAESIFEGRRIRWDRDPWGLLWDMPIPTIASLHGVAVGSGLEMAMLCDIRLAGPTTKTGLPETKLGMLPAAGGTQSLTKTIGPHGAVPIVALAETLSDRQAYDLGLITELADDPDSRALELAERLASFEPSVVKAIRRAVKSAGDHPLSAGLALEHRLARSVHGAG